MTFVQLIFDWKQKHVKTLESLFNRRGTVTVLQT
jgi:hypothetical protein